MAVVSWRRDGSATAVVPQGSGAIIAYGVESFPPDLFLEGYPPGIRKAAERLRAVVRQAVPEAFERVRPGWRLIGYEVPVGRRSRYFAFVWPEVEHVHLGFEYGVWMADPDGLLLGAHLHLRKVRFVTCEPGARYPSRHSSSSPTRPPGWPRCHARSAWRARSTGD